MPRERIFQGPALAQCKLPTAQQPTLPAFLPTPKKLEELFQGMVGENKGDPEIHTPS